MISTGLLVALITLVQAHELWMQPDKFTFKAGENLVVSFMAGENFIGAPWDLKTHRLTKLELKQQTKSTNLLDLLTSPERKTLTIPLKDEGTHLLLMQTENTFIELEGEKFDEYLKEDGLDEIYALRQKTNILNKPSSEYYSLHSKLLVQVGSHTDDTFRKVAGFPIEIIPERNPYMLKKGDPVRFRILFEGKPLFGAKVKVWNRFNNRTTIQNIYTEKSGMIETHISNPGRWMVSVVKMVPSKQDGAEWQRYRGSLVFGVE